MIETVPNDMLNLAVRNLKHNSALYLKGNYRIKEPLRCTNKIGVSIFGNHSRIIAAPGFPTDQPMLDCCGTFRSTFNDLWLETDPGSLPAAGLVIGRNATPNGKPMNGGKCPPLNQWHNGECPNGPLDVSKKPPPYNCIAAPWSGGKCLFSNIDIKGTYGVSPYYNCMGENHTFLNSAFRSDNEKPAYVDTCYDFAKLTGLQCINYSNVDKYFYACVFSNGATDAVENGVQLVNLYRSGQNISFRDCYFATGPHPGSTVIDLTQGGENGQTFNLLIDGGRVEIGGKIPIEDPSGIRLLRISRKCEDTRIVGLRYCIESNYVIHLKGKGQLVNPTLSISTKFPNMPLIEDTRP
jgi:hypothetical protein